MVEPPGAILLVSVCHNDEFGAGGNALDEPAWAIVRAVPEAWRGTTEWVWVDWLTISQDVDALQVGWDEWHTVPEDEVPDHVWAALAKLRLIGDNDGA